MASEGLFSVHEKHVCMVESRYYFLGGLRRRHTAAYPVGQLTAIWRHKRKLFVEYQSYALPKEVQIKRPYWGEAAVVAVAQAVQIGDPEEVIGEICSVESLEQFRVRDSFEMGKSFYIADTVSPDGSSLWRAWFVFDMLRTEPLRKTQHQLVVQKHATGDAAAMRALVESSSSVENVVDDEDDDDEDDGGKKKKKKGDAVLKYVPQKGTSRRDPPVLQKVAPTKPTKVDKAKAEEPKKKRRSKKGSDEEEDILLFGDDDDDDDDDGRDQKNTTPSRLRRHDGSTQAAAPQSDSKRARQVKKPLALSKVDRLKSKQISFDFERDDDIYQYVSEEGGDDDDDEDDEDDGDDDEDDKLESDSQGKSIAEAARRQKRLKMTKRSDQSDRDLDLDADPELDDFVVDDEDDEAEGEGVAILPAQFSRTVGQEAAFGLWVEYMFFAMMDSKFQHNVKEDDEMSSRYAPRIGLEKKLRGYVDSIGGGGHWDRTVRSEFHAWSRASESGSGPRSIDVCALCNRSSAETLHVLVLHGRKYDAEKFWADTVLELTQPRKVSRDSKKAVSMLLGEHCLHKALLYHRAYHFKYRLYSDLERSSDEAMEKEPQLRQQNNIFRLQRRVLTDEWKKRHYDEMESVLRQCHQLLLN